MDADRTSSVTKRQFKFRSDESKKKLLEGKDKANTQRATKTAIRLFNDFLQAKQLPNIEALTVDLNDLNGILCDFYSEIKPQKEEDYSVQTLKCLRSGLNRWYRKERGIDIVNDTSFVQSNEMLKAVQVESKKNGKGVRKSYPPISSIDLEKIAEYFSHDHVSKPEPRRLQQNMVFYIIYFFCRRGQENLYTMTKETFSYIVDHDGTEYFKQQIDEMDKNHGPSDYNMTNEGRMYATGGKKNIFGTPKTV